MTTMQCRLSRTTRLFWCAEEQGKMDGCPRFSTDAVAARVRDFAAMAHKKKLEEYEKKREAWGLKEQGLSYTQIAKRLDVHPGEVIHRLYGWGYEPPSSRSSRSS
jgi:hypothetical protein